LVVAVNSLDAPRVEAVEVVQVGEDGLLAETAALREPRQRDVEDNSDEDSREMR
jgi:hypothetical protein